MKRSSTTKLLLMGMAPLLLAACEGPDTQVASAPASAASVANTSIVNHQYKTVDECTKAGNPQDVCQQAFDKATQFAVAQAPHFGSRDACVDEYGADRCQEDHDSSGNSFWGPMMTGFLISQMLNNNQPTYIVNSQPIYMRSSGSYYVPSSSSWDGGASGRSSSYSSSSGSGSLAGTSAVTSSRGGFGSAAAARGSWGGGSSSSFGG